MQSLTAPQALRACQDACKGLEAGLSMKAHVDQLEDLLRRSLPVEDA